MGAVEAGAGVLRTPWEGEVEAWTDPSGRRWRVLHGDFSHLPEHDRPPKVICENLVVGARIHYDRSETREAIPVTLPGKDIRELAGRHSGKVAILFNGHSLPSARDLHLLRCPLIGVNRTHVGHPSYSGPSPDYLCVIDSVWLMRKEVTSHPGLVNGSHHPGNFGWRVPKSYRMSPFSFDLYRDGAVPTTTGLLALQVAVYLGFRDIYCLGLDLGGPHYDGTPSGGNMQAQLRLMVLAFPLLNSRGVKVWVCGSPESALPFYPRCSFEELLGSAT